MLGMVFWEAAAAEAPPADNTGLSWDHQQFHFNLPSVSRGIISSDTYVGDITLCYFWADWNRTSLDQVAWLNQFWNQYRHLGVQFVGFCLDPDEQMFKRVFVPAGWQFACARLPSRQLIASQGPVRGLPTLLVLAPGGLVVRKYEGLFSLELLEKDVLELLRQKE
jgi:hypothetical protein